MLLSGEIKAEIWREIKAEVDSIRAPPINPTIEHPLAVNYINRRGFSWLTN